MAQDFPRVQFTMPGATHGALDETIDMISATDDNIRAAVLTFLHKVRFDVTYIPPIQSAIEAFPWSMLVAVGMDREE